MALPKADLYLNNDFDVEIGPLSRENLATGEDEVATGLSFSTFLSTSKLHDATPIHADLNLSMSERGALGIYYATFQGDVITTHLAALVGQTIYRHVKNSAVDYHTVLQLKVRDPRPAATS